MSAVTGSQDLPLLSKPGSQDPLRDGIGVCYNMDVVNSHCIVQFVMRQGDPDEKSRGLRRSR